MKKALLFVSYFSILCGVYAMTVLFVVAANYDTIAEPRETVRKLMLNINSWYYVLLGIFGTIVLIYKAVEGGHRTLHVVLTIIQGVLVLLLTFASS